MITQYEKQRILRTAEKHKRSKSDNIINDAKEEDNFDSELWKTVFKRYREVLKESQKIKTLTRLEVHKERLLIGRINDEHETGGSILQYFMEKFPTFYILIFSNYGLFYGSKKICLEIEPIGTNDEEIIREFKDKLEEKIKKLGLREVKEDFSEKLWETYYDSQYIPSRKNIKAQNNACLPCKERLEELRQYAKKKENNSLKEYQ